MQAASVSPINAGIQGHAIRSTHGGAVELLKNTLGTADVPLGDISIRRGLPESSAKHYASLGGVMEAGKLAEVPLRAAVNGSHQGTQAIAAPVCPPNRKTVRDEVSGYNAAAPQVSTERALWPCLHSRRSVSSPRSVGLEPCGGENPLYTPEKTPLEKPGELAEVLRRVYRHAHTRYPNLSRSQRLLEGFKEHTRVGQSFSDFPTFRLLRYNNESKELEVLSTQMDSIRKIENVFHRLIHELYVLTPSDREVHKEELDRLRSDLSAAAGY